MLVQPVSMPKTTDIAVIRKVDSQNMMESSPLFQGEFSAQGRAYFRMMA